MQANNLLNTSQSGMLRDPNCYFRLRSNAFGCLYLMWVLYQPKANWNAKLDIMTSFSWITSINWNVRGYRRCTDCVWNFTVTFGLILTYLCVCGMLSRITYLFGPCNSHWMVKQTDVRSLSRKKCINNFPPSPHFPLLLFIIINVSLTSSFFDLSVYLIPSESKIIPLCNKHLKNQLPPCALVPRIIFLS